MINITEFISCQQSQLQAIVYMVIFKNICIINLINYRCCCFYLICWTCLTCLTCLIFLPFSYLFSSIFMNCSISYISEISFNHLEGRSSSCCCWLAPNSSLCFVELGLFRGGGHFHLSGFFSYFTPIWYYIFDNP